MQDINQKTILKPIKFEGIGLHSGLLSKVKLIPSEENTGIVFKRVDLTKDNLIKADYKNVSSAKLCTTLQNSSGVTVSTVEHLMAAFYVTGVDNVIIEIDNPEVPIMDGSSLDFVNLINKSGLKRLLAKRKYLKIIKDVKFEDNKKIISISPSNNEESLKVSFEIDYENEFIQNQKNEVNFNNKELEQVYSSRTFCLYEDIEKIKKNGLAKGGSLDNAIVVKGNEVLNKDGLRNKKEFVNHKILDLAGDFLLSGYRILGNVNCVHGGHLLTNTFLKKLFEESSNFKEVVIDDIKSTNRVFKTQISKIAVNA